MYFTTVQRGKKYKQFIKMKIYCQGEREEEGGGEEEGEEQEGSGGGRGEIIMITEMMKTGKEREKMRH